MAKPNPAVMGSVDYLFRSKKQEPKKQEARSRETRFSALLQLSLPRCRKASQAGVPGEVNCGAAVLAALPLPDLPGPEVAKGDLGDGGDVATTEREKREREERERKIERRISRGRTEGV